MMMISETNAHFPHTVERRAFSVAGPMAWNALPAWRPPRPVAQCWQFPEDAKDASVSECTWTISALEALRNALYKFKTYLLTYLLTYLVTSLFQFIIFKFLWFLPDFVSTLRDARRAPPGSKSRWRHWRSTSFISSETVTTRTSTVVRGTAGIPARNWNILVFTWSNFVRWKYLCSNFVKNRQNIGSFCPLIFLGCGYPYYCGFFGHPRGSMPLTEIQWRSNNVNPPTWRAA